MKKIVILVSIALVLGLVVGCPQPNDSGNGGGGEKVYVKPADEKTKNLGDHNFTLKGIKGGSFLMGEGVQKTTRQTSVDSFLLAETEVTQGQWEKVMLDVYGEGNDLWPGSIPLPSYGKSTEHPAYEISWDDAVEFCNALSRKEGLTHEQVYYEDTDSDGEYSEGDTVIDTTNRLNNSGSVVVKPGATGYRLPTEAEWEYAAGGGESDARTIYAGTDTDSNDPNVDDLGDYAWYQENAGDTTHIVGTAGTEGSTTPKSGNDNDLGLYDMSGNVWEWCWDRYVDPYDTSVTDNPTGPTSGSKRVARGGCWYNISSGLRVAKRDGSAPNTRNEFIGFRVARSVE